MSPEDDSVDLILRHISQRFPDELARGLLGCEGPLTAAVLETQVTSRHRELDRTLDVRIDGERRLLHVEWQTAMPANMPYRTYEYQALLGFAVAEENKSGPELVPPIESIVVLLGGREEPWPLYGTYRVSPRGAPFSGVHFRIEPVYQRTIAELAAWGSFWLAFAPLAVDADERSVARVLGELRARVPPATFDELGTAMAVLAEADQRERGLRDVVRSLLPRELVMQNWIYKEGLEEGYSKGIEKGIEQGIERGIHEGIEKGIHEGLRPLVHLLERRLGRALTEPERATLLARIRVDGPDRVGDAVLDLSPQDLAAWIAPTNGH
ncbi:hypothetical protein [Polyangium sp. y55x31]|uniref:hypothetical protein n=1 Tax=Polyangium sp. y55x31 TaxID=3042688 RepID=UPI00248295D8|nr:hypothetical protein [Polyangium sp. y55x31]MDI1484056.1 hypothetical protein [Polyangium sp. y55x31]